MNPLKIIDKKIEELQEIIDKKIINYVIEVDEYLQDCSDEGREELIFFK